MADLLTQQNAGGPPMVLSFIVTDIEFARRKDPHAYEIEDIVFGVIETACDALE